MFIPHFFVWRNLNPTNPNKLIIMKPIFKPETLSSDILVYRYIGIQSEASGTSLLSRESMRDRDWLCCTTQHPRTSGTKPTQASFRIEELTMVTEWLDWLMSDSKIITNTWYQWLNYHHLIYYNVSILICHKVPICTFILTSSKGKVKYSYTAVKQITKYYNLLFWFHFRLSILYMVSLLFNQFNCMQLIDWMQKQHRSTLTTNRIVHISPSFQEFEFILKFTAGMTPIWRRCRQCLSRPIFKFSSLIARRFS